MHRSSKIGKFPRNPVSRAVLALSALAATAPAALAGPGFGDAFDLNNIPFVIQSYFASSPAGARLWTPIMETVQVNGVAVTRAKLDANGQPMLAPDSYDPANREAYDAQVKAFYPGGYPGTGKALRKFVDPLPLLGAANAKTMADGLTQKYIPVAKPAKWVNPQGVTTGDDYYEIAAIEYSERMHSDLAKPTTVRGYVQIDVEASNGRTPLAGSKSAALTYPNGQAILIAATDIRGKLTGAKVQARAYDNPHYLGPVIQAVKDTPTRLKFLNLLPVGRAVTSTDANGKVTVSARNGDLQLPVDLSITGAGYGPDGLHTYTQNRTNIHLHGGDNPWMSDGGPHTWITPGGESDPAQAGALAADASLDPALLPAYLRGAGAVNVPDMNNPGAGAMTYYFPNGQSARMEWYHDHSVGVTRLNVYAGMVSAYLLTDATEQALIADGTLPGADATIPMILQDKTFVPKDIAFQDGRWNTSAWGAEGDLWFPHVYETVQDPGQATNFNAVGRWHWGPWFWPSYPSLYNLPTGAYGDVTTTPEAWSDTPMVNGVAYPTMTVEPKPYRLRILNAANDRTFTFNMFVADDNVVTDDGRTHTEVRMVPVGSGVPCADPAATRSDGVCTPQGWSSDVYGHSGGLPDPATQGPTLYQIANEGGLLPGLAPKDPTPLSFLLDKGRAAVLNTDFGASGLHIGNAERADVLVDFSQYAGKTLIIYSDAGAPVPAADPRNEYFTGYGDLSATGGAEDTRPGYGPNSRTLMQIKVSAAGTVTGTPVVLNPAALDTKIKAAYAATQDRPLVAQSAYNAAFGTSWTDNQAFASIFNGSIKLPAFAFVPGTPSAQFNAFLLQSYGSGYTRLPSATLSAPPAGGVRATVTPAMKIDQIQVINGGTGYKLAPIVSITSTGKGSGANAVSSLSLSAVSVVSGGSGYSGGNVTGVTLTSGGAYTPAVTSIALSNASTNRYPGTQVPAVTIAAPGAGGVQATATAVMTGNGIMRRVASVTVTNGGKGYASPPVVTIAAATGTGVKINAKVSTVTTARTAPTLSFAAPAGGTAATGTVVFDAANGVVTDVTLTNAGAGYTSAPAASFVGGTVATAASASTTVSPLAALIISAPQGAGGITATGTPIISPAGAITGVNISNGGSGYSSAPTVKVTGGSGAVLSASSSVSAITLTQPDPGNLLSAGGGGYTDLSTLASEPNNLSPGLTITISVPTLAGGITATAGATGKVFDLTISNPGSGYTSAPTVSFSPAASEPVYAAQNSGLPNYTRLNIAKVAPVAAADRANNGVAQGSILVKTKAIQELFDPTYGRLNATFGVEIPYTSALTQTTIPLGYVDAPTEEIADGETQIWKITHNGVDTHPVHFHLVNVQLINRVGWDNFVNPPEPNELGWKETIKMSPLEDVIVAVRAKKPKLGGFGLPNSVRLLDPSQPEGATTGFTQIDANTGLPAPMGNAIYDFGWEYVWHCHILGHEENDFMRPIVFHANEALPDAATGLLAAQNGTSVDLAWTDNATTEFSYRVERAPIGGTQWTPLATLLANASQYSDLTAGAGASVQYRVVATGQGGETTSTVAVVTVPPAAPTGLVAATRSSAPVSLSWTDNANNETSYKVERSVAGSGAWTTLTAALAVNSTAYIDNTAVGTAAYDYRVSAVNSAGAALSNTVSVAAASAVPAMPGAPGKPAVSKANVNALQANVTVTWAAPTTGGTVASYTLQRCSGGTCTNFADLATGLTVRTFTSSTVRGITYRFRVQAINTGGSSAYSAITNFAN